MHVLWYHNVMTFLTKVIATFFGVGYIPLVPATWASALTVVLAWYLPYGLGYWILAFFAAGLWACAPSRAVFKSKDPKQFVMDEVVGMGLSVLWLPKNLSLYAAAFILFRILDVWKPGFISKIDEQDHPFSILLDDVAAGVLANVILQVAVRTIWHL